MWVQLPGEVGSGKARAWHREQEAWVPARTGWRHPWAPTLRRSLPPPAGPGSPRDGRATTCDAPGQAPGSAYGTGFPKSAPARPRGPSARVRTRPLGPDWKERIAVTCRAARPPPSAPPSPAAPSCKWRWNPPAARQLTDCLAAPPGPPVGPRPRNLRPAISYPTGWPAPPVRPAGLPAPPNCPVGMTPPTCLPHGARSAARPRYLPAHGVLILGKEVGGAGRSRGRQGGRGG